MPRGYPGTAKAKAPTQAALLQDVILELQLVNAGQERIETQKLPALGASISKLSTETQLSVADLHDPLDNIFETLKRTFNYFVGNDLQMAEDRKEMLAALEGIRSATLVRSESSNSNNLGPAEEDRAAPGWGKRLLYAGLFGAALGVLGAGFTAGLVTEVAAQFTHILKYVQNTKIGAFVTRKLAPFFGAEGRIMKFFTGFGLFFNKLGKFATRMTSAFGRFATAMAFDSALGFMVNIPKLLGPVYHLGKTLGKVLGKLAIPITVIIALWDSVKGAYDGYKADGLVGALRGATIGLWNSLVGWLIDIPKAIVSFISEKLGFGEFSQWLDSWDFKQVFTACFDWVSGAIENLFKFLGEAWNTPGMFTEWIGEVVESVWIIIKDVWKDVLESLRGAAKTAGQAISKGVDFGNEIVKEILKASLPKWDNQAMLGAMSPNNVAVAALKTAGVYEYAGLSPDTGKSIAATPSKAGSTLSNESSKEKTGNTTIINNYGGNTTNTSSSNSSSSINALNPNNERSFANGMDFGFGY